MTTLPRVEHARERVATDVAEAWLTDGQITEAQRLAERLQGIVVAVLKSLPKENQSASGLARFAEVERTLCQRLVGSLVGSAVNPETLTKIPGPKTIKMLAAALTSRNIAADDLDAIAPMLDQFFEQAGKTQRGFARLLERRLNIHSPAALENAAHVNIRTGSAEDASLQRRLRLFQAARETMGAHSRSVVQIVIFAPSRDNPELLDIGRTRGVSGYRATPGAVPLMFSLYREGEAAAGGTREFAPLGDTKPGTVGPSGLLEEFSTRPLPQFIIKQKGQWIFHIVDRMVGERNGIDLIYADQTLGGLARPTNELFRCDEVWASFSTPTEGVVCDAYLHRDLAQRCIPGLDVQLPLMNLQELREERWATRVSTGPHLKVLGTGLKKAASPLYPRHAELTETLFKKFGRDPSDFVGFRCEEIYPEWRLAYRLFFDYGTASKNPSEEHGNM